MLVKAASAFRSDIYLVKNSQEVNGKSIMGVMMLAAGKGERLTIKARGDDAERAVEALVALITSGFGE
jgi:phosphocarrier protein